MSGIFGTPSTPSLPAKSLREDFVEPHGGLLEVLGLHSLQGILAVELTVTHYEPPRALGLLRAVQVSARGCTCKKHTTKEEDTLHSFMSQSTPLLGSLGISGAEDLIVLLYVPFSSRLC